MPSASPDRRRTLGLEENPAAAMQHSWRIKAQEDSLARISAWINTADAKASSLLVISAALIASLVALAARPGSGSGSAPYLLSVGAALPVTGTVFAALAIIPRIKGTTPSLLFFGDIASLSEEEYGRKVTNHSVDDYLADLVAQCHVNSRIAASKFRWIRRGTLALLLGIVPWLISLSFLAAG